MPTYKIQNIARILMRVTFKSKLSLPVAHPELYSIEMAWSKIKREGTTKNLNFRLSALEERLKLAVLKLTASELNNCIKHVGVQELKWGQTNS